MFSAIFRTNIGHFCHKSSAIVACQIPLSTEFSRQKSWSGQRLPSPGGLPDPGTEPGSSALQAGDWTTREALHSQVTSAINRHPTLMSSHYSQQFFFFFFFTSSKILNPIVMPKISNAKGRKVLLPSSSWGSHRYRRIGYREEPQVLDYIVYIGSILGKKRISR